MLATGLSAENEDRQRAILLHCIGMEGQRIFNTLKDTATTIATQVEAAQKDATLLAGNSNPQAPDSSDPNVNHIKSRSNYNRSRAPIPQATRTEDKCRGCGETGHWARDQRCPAKGKVCSKCGKRNHLAKCYWSHPEENKISNIDMNNVVVLSVNADDEQLKRVSVQLENVAVTLLADSGAKVSIINEDTYDKHFKLGSKLVEANRNLIGYCGTRINVIGCVWLRVAYNGKKVKQHMFYVTEKGSNIMGMDLLKRLGFQLCQINKVTSNLSNDWKEAWCSVFTEELGLMTGYAHRPKIDPSVKPVIQPLRRLPLSIREEVSVELKRLEDAGIIERVEASPWVSNVVIARKKSGEIRLCVDLRQANKAVVPDKFPIPTIEELAAQFHGSKLFTKLDMKQGYSQVELTEDVRHISAFITHEGLFQYRRVPFGLSSAGCMFQKAVTTILQGVQGCANIIDDIIVHAPTKELHDRRVNEVLSRLEAHGVTLNAHKCEFEKHEVEFYGFTVNQNGVKPLESNTKAILDLPEPTNITEVASFLGMSNFYMKFVPFYADITEPLRKLLRKDMPWSWENEQREACTKIKNLLCAAPILAHFDPDAETFITTGRFQPRLRRCVIAKTGGCREAGRICISGTNPNGAEVLGVRKRKPCVRLGIRKVAFLPLRKSFHHKDRPQSTHNLAGNLGQGSSTSTVV